MVTHTSISFSSEFKICHSTGPRIKSIERPRISRTARWKAHLLLCISRRVKCCHLTFVLALENSAHSSYRSDRGRGKSHGNIFIVFFKSSVWVSANFGRSLAIPGFSLECPQGAFLSFVLLPLSSAVSVWDDDDDDHPSGRIYTRRRVSWFRQEVVRLYFAAMVWPFLAVLCSVRSEFHAVRYVSFNWEFIHIFF